MPLVVTLQEAGGKLKNKFNRQLDVEKRFSRTQSLGDFNSNGFAVNDQFPSTLDGDPVVRTYDDFTINEGHVITTVNRCKGLYLFINGNLIINGTLSMTARGANAPGKFIGILPNTDEILFNDTDVFTDKDIVTIPAIGGLGADRAVRTKQYTPRTTHGNAGLSKFRGSGGGASGGCQIGYDQSGHTIYSGAGAAGTSFSGGSGGGGVGVRDGSYSAFPGIIDGGKGGNGRAAAPSSRGTAGGTGGAGAAGPGTHQWAEYSYDGDIKFDTGFGNGAGGLIILIVKGSVTIGPTGKILSRGTQAPGISSYANPTSIGTGGGSGGGIAMLFHKGEFRNDGEISLIGGLGGYTVEGGKGGQGGTGHFENIRF